MSRCPEVEIGAPHAVLVAAVAVATALVAASKRRVQHIALAILSLNALAGFARGRGWYYYYIAQPIVVAFGSAALVKQYGGIADALGALYVVIVAAVTAAIDPCSGSIWVNLPDLVLVVYLLVGVAGHCRAVYPTWCAVESAALAALLSRASTSEIALRAEHLTWWSIALFGLWDLTLFIEFSLHANTIPLPRKLSQPLTTTVSVVNTIVLFGVLFMSAESCALLTDALHDAGVPLYLVGNFAMHYYPVLRTIFSLKSVSLDAALKGVAITIVYIMAYPATDVYGCNQPAPAYAASIFGGVGIATTAVFIFVDHLLNYGRLGTKRETSFTSKIFKETSRIKHVVYSYYGRKI